MYGIHTRFASAAISDGFGFDGDIVDRVQVNSDSEYVWNFYMKISECMSFYDCLNVAMDWHSKRRMVGQRVYN